MQVVYKIGDIVECGEVTKDFTQRDRDKGVYIKQPFTERWIPVQSIVKIVETVES